MTSPEHPNGSSDRHVGRILNDYLDRRARGRAEPEAEFLANHPDLADEFRSHLDLVRDLQPEWTSLAALIDQGLLDACDEPAHPARLGPYKISQYLGRGGMGIVVKAREPSLNRTVALKVLRPELADAQATLARFTREAKAAAALRHPNIVTVYAIGHERAVHYIATEFIDGPTLADVVQKGWPTSSETGNRAASASERTRSEDTHLPTETIRHIFRQLLSALAAAHEAGLIHRDVKSANILVDCGLKIDDWRFQSRIPHAQSSIVNHQSSIVKLADFGLARMLTAQTRLTIEGSTPGTPEYMSPEQARGDEHLDHRTDLYSAGVVLYEMLTGRTPFQADTSSAVIHQILHDHPPDPRKLTPTADPSLATLALRLMAKRPEDRLDSATAAVRALDVGERVRSIERCRRLRRRCLAAVAVLLLLTAAVWLWPRPTQPPASPASADRLRPPIRDVRVDKDQDGANTLTISASYGDDPVYEVFHECPQQAGFVRAAVLVNQSGDRGQVVAFGTHRPINGEFVFALDASQKDIWKKNLSSDRDWPGCDPRPRSWHMRTMIAAELDGAPGDELVVIVDDPIEYPSRICILEPSTGEPRTSFWHLGHLKGIRTVPGYFGNDRPALLAWGLNNKLDGFDDGLRVGERQFAHWDTVGVAMILDPQEMDGLGPPPTRRIADLPPAYVQAYAFFDLPYTPGIAAVPERGHSQEINQAQPTTSQEVAGIIDVRDAWQVPQDGTGPWLEIIAEGLPEAGKTVFHPGFLVDRNLTLRDVAPTVVQGEQATKQYWDQYWRPIIRNGEYVRD